MVSVGNKLANRIQWVRQKLIDVGKLSNLERGLWSITDNEKQRLKWVPQQTVHISDIGSKISMVEIYDNYAEDFKYQLLDDCMKWLLDSLRYLQSSYCRYMVL